MDHAPPIAKGFRHMDTPQTIRHYRELRGLSKPELAKRIGVSARQLARYEESAADSAQPPLSVAARLADALDVSMNTLAGRGTPTIDLSGEWWSAWQTWMDDIERVEVEHLKIQQEGNFLVVTGSPDPAHTNTGSFSWHGEGRLIRDRCLALWYVATTDGVASNGSIHVTLDPQGILAVGRWMGLSHDGINECGKGAIARSREVATAALDAVHGVTGTIKEIPEFTVNSSATA